MGLLPNWVKEIDIGDFFRGIKDDAIAGAKSFGTGTKNVLGSVRGILTPTILWIFAIAIIGLVILKNYKKVLKV